MREWVEQTQEVEDLACECACLFMCVLLPTWHMHYVTGINIAKIKVPHDRAIVGVCTHMLIVGYAHNATQRNTTQHTTTQHKRKQRLNNNIDDADDDVNNNNNDYNTPVSHRPVSR